LAEQVVNRLAGDGDVNLSSRAPYSSTPQQSPLPPVLTPQLQRVEMSLQQLDESFEGTEQLPPTLSPQQQYRVHESF
jgi:hypothetical protein